MTQLRDRVVLITGANRGLGAALVAEVLARGAATVIAASRAGTGSTHPNVQTVRLDITEPAQVEAAADRFDDVAIVVNNAGVNRFGSALTAPMEAIRDEIETNYLGTLRMMRAFAPRMARREGAAFVNVVSICGLAPMPGLGGYSASKAALASVTGAMGPECEALGIAVHAVFPGPIDTDMNTGRQIDSIASAAAVAARLLDGIEAGQDRIYPDEEAEDARQEWSRDPAGLARRFAEFR